MPEYTGPHDYFDEAYVTEWERIANDRRPFRAEFFNAFAAEVATLDKPRVLDLGSGAGNVARMRAAGTHVPTTVATSPLGGWALAQWADTGG